MLCNRSVALSFTVLLLLLLTSFAKPSTPIIAQPLQAAPPLEGRFGIFTCPALENGLLVTAVEFTISPDGQMVEHTRGQKVAWRYDPNEDFEFPEELGVKRAIYVPGKDQYKLLLYPNAHREHVRGNQLDCVRVPEVGEHGRFSPHTPALTTPTPLTTTVATQRIAYTFADGGNEDIYLIDPDGSNRTQITDHPASDADPDWSPDGKQLLFASNRDGNLHIYKINADGTGLQPLTTGDSTNIMPAWAPNGEKIAFASNRDGDLEIFIMNADGSNLTQLTDNDTADKTPTWAPNSKQMAFVAERDGHEEIYVMDNDGSNQTRLTYDPDFPAYDPAWSPDGYKIAFTTHYDGHEGIAIMDSDGRRPIEITTGSADFWLPAWSVDGQEIVFSSNQNGDDDLYAMLPDGSNMRQLTNDIGADAAADWGVQDVYVQRVFHIIYDPYLPERGRLLSSYFVDPRQQVYDVVGSLQSHTDQRVQYVLQDQVVVDAFPPRSDGFLHDEASYMGCMASNWPNTATCAGFVWADYDSIINDPTLDICGRLNRDEIDEVWLDMMPRTGFYESVLAGPTGFAYNGPTFTANTCGSLIPIMAMNYEWTWDGGHIFGRILMMVRGCMWVMAAARRG